MKVSLKHLEIQVACNKKSLDDLRRSLGNGTGQANAANNKGNHTSNKGGGGRIPKKADRVATAAGAAGGHAKKHCMHCAKWSAGISHTHNTSECRKWNADGSQKGKGGYQGKGTYANTNQSGDSDYKKAFAQQAKETKSLKKMMLQQTKAFKKSKKRSHKNKSSDSDGSSDSE